MEIHLNGKTTNTQSSTLQELIIEAGFKPEALIAELNFKVIKQDQWHNTSITDGDQIELLSFVGGG